MPQLHVKSGGRAAQRIELLAGVIRIGRVPTNDCWIDDPTVSGRHCEITVQEGTVLVRDLGSTNGTFIDGEPINQAMLLPGQTLRLGTVEITMEDLPARVAIPPLASAQPVAVPVGGVPGCYNHSTSHATMACPQCGKTFCELCVHQVRRLGGMSLKLCPVCGVQCRAIEQFKVEQKRRSLISSWIGKITARVTGRSTRANEVSQESTENNQGNKETTTNRT